MLLQLIVGMLMIVLFLFIYLLDRTKDKVFSFFSFPAIFILVFSLVNFSSYTRYIDFNSFQLGFKSYITVLIILLAYVFGFFIPYIFRFNDCSAPIVKAEEKYNLTKINQCIYFSFFISTAALLTNLSNIGFNIGALFEGARDYEKSFGENWLVNYMYFMHVPTMLLIIFKSKMFRDLNRVDVFIFSFSLIYSIFHGIKFTVFDALFFPLFFYIALNGFSKKAKITTAFIIFTFTTFFALFSFWVRGGGENFNFFAIVDYLVPNYINLFYAIESNEILYAYPVDMFFNSLTSFIDVPRVLPGVEFTVNEKYNMVTGFVFIIAGYYYLFSFLFFTSMIYLYIYFRKNNSLIGGFMCAYILFSIFMIFYAYYFGAKYKYIYYIVVLYGFDAFCKCRVSK